MDVFEYVDSRLTLNNLLSSVLIVFSFIQLYYSIRCFKAHRHFFNTNPSMKKIHDRSNTSLLGYTLNVLSTLDNPKDVSKIVSISTIVCILIMLFLNEAIMQKLSTLLGIISLISWLYTSRNNNRIVLQVLEAKPTIDNAMNQ